MTGEVLKKRREELGLEIAAVADLLKIRADYISSIELNSFEKLPAPVYTLGYVRSYANYLGVDADALVRYYTEHLSQPAHNTIIPVGYSQKKYPKFLAVIPVLLIAAAVFFLYPRFQKQAATGTMPPGQAFTGKPPQAAQKEGVKSLSLPAVPVGNSGGTLNPAADERGISSDGVKNGQHSLDVVALDTTWISIKFKDGTTEEILFRPGGAKNWRFMETASLKIGNAGGIRLQLDGKNLGTPGDPGQVKILTLPYN